MILAVALFKFAIATLGARRAFVTGIERNVRATIGAGISAFAGLFAGFYDILH